MENRVQDQLLRFLSLHQQLTDGKINEASLKRMESVDNVFLGMDYRYWAWDGRSADILVRFGCRVANGGQEGPRSSCNGR